MAGDILAKLGVVNVPLINDRGHDSNCAVVKTVLDETARELDIGVEVRVSAIMNLSFYLLIVHIKPLLFYSI